MIDGDAAAWHSVLYEAIRNHELDYVKTPNDVQNTDLFGDFNAELR